MQARKVVYASSSSVYGDAVGFPRIETIVPQPISPYAVSKPAGEQYCRVFYETYGLRTVALRYSTSSGRGRTRFPNTRRLSPGLLSLP